MTLNLPGTEIPDIREYLFVDDARVRMLVSQLRGGVPEASTSTRSRSHKLLAGLKFLGAEKGGEQSSEDTIALSDLHVSMLEEDAEALGMLADISEEARDKDFWGRGGQRKRLKPGMLARVTAPTRLMDPQSITQVFRKFNRAIESDDAGEFENMLDTIDALYGNHLSLTVLPRGEQSSTNAFVGVIDHQVRFGGLDRGSLFSRLGPDPSELTTIMQIARIPAEATSSASEDRIKEEFEKAFHRRLGDGSLDRNALDQFVTATMKLIEEYGLQSAPLWPSMAITPLAVYRHVPKLAVSE